MDATHLILNVLMTLAMSHQKNLTAEQIGVLYRRARAVGRLCQHIVDEILHGSAPDDGSADPEVLIRLPGHRDRYEYLVRHYTTLKYLDDELPGLGEEGWELAALCENDGLWHAYYKRKMETRIAK